MPRDLIKSDLTLKTCCPKKKKYRINDGKGLFLLVNPDGSKYWRFNYSFKRKRKEISMGVYPDTSLKKARLKADDCRNLIEKGIDPSQVRQAEKETVKKENEDEKRLEQGIPLENSFADIANQWLKSYQPTVSENTYDKVFSRMHNHIFPVLGAKSIADIKAPDVLALVKPIADRQTVETAHRVLNHCHRVFKYAVAHGLMEYDPSPAVIDALPANKVKHRAAITEPRQVGQLMRDIDEYTGTYVVKCALTLSPFLFARPGEIRQMEWKDVDFQAKEWRYFVTKTAIEHIVPLSRQAIAILKDVQLLTGSGRYVFPSARGASRPMSNNAVRLALRAMGYDKDTMSAHGFRTTASTLLNEQGWSPDAIERQLAHTAQNKIRAAYNRAQYLDERRRMMQAWSDYLDSLKNGAEVIPIKKQV